MALQPVPDRPNPRTDGPAVPSLPVRSSPFHGTPYLIKPLLDCPGLPDRSLPVPGSARETTAFPCCRCAPLQTRTRQTLPILPIRHHLVYRRLSVYSCRIPALHVRPYRSRPCATKGIQYCHYSADRNQPQRCPPLPSLAASPVLTFARHDAEDHTSARHTPAFHCCLACPFSHPTPPCHHRLVYRRLSVCCCRYMSLRAAP
jgi:hypothetical protein